MYKIAIDIDDTINERQIHDLELGMQFCRKHNIQYDHVDLTQRYATEMFGMPDEYHNEYKQISFPSSVKNCKTKPFVEERIRGLIRDGIDVYIVTSRQPDRNKEDESYKGYMMKRDTYAWFAKHDFGILDEKIIFGIHDKGLYCKENDFSLLVDDKPEHITECVKNRIPVILVTQSFNSYVLDIYGRNSMVYDGKNNWNVIDSLIRQILKSVN